MVVCILAAGTGTFSLMGMGGSASGKWVSASGFGGELERMTCRVDSLSSSWSVFGGRPVEVVVRGLWAVKEDGILGVFEGREAGMWFETSRSESCGRFVEILRSWCEGRGRGVACSAEIEVFDFPKKLRMLP